MENKILKLYQSHPAVVSKKGSFRQLNESFSQALIATDFIYQKQNIIVCLPNLYEAQKYYDALSQMLSNEDVLFYPADQTLTTMMALGSFEFRNERLYTLRQLLKNEKPYVVVTTQHGLLQRQLKPIDYINSVLMLEKKQVIPVEKLSKILTYNGYQRNYVVERPGEFSVRGNIVDIFTHDNKNPYRLDFFGDEIETIKIFDVETQKSFEQVENLSVSPLQELFFTDEQKEITLKKIHKYFAEHQLSEKEQHKYQQDLEHLEQRKRLDGLLTYIPFFNEEPTTLLNFSQKHKVYIFDIYKMEVNEKTAQEDIKTYNHTMGGHAFGDLSIALPLEYLKKQEAVYMHLFDLTDSKAIPLKVADVSETKGEAGLLLHLLSQYQTYDIVYTSDNLSNKSKVEDLFLEHKIAYNDKNDKKSIQLLDEYLSKGFIDHEQKKLFLTDKELLITKQGTRIRYRSVVNQAVKIRDVSELKVGDYVVHYDYGIGQYIGIQTMALSGPVVDYIRIKYANDDYLNVPVDQIALILKYRSFDEVEPKLSNLYGKAWDKTKTQVKKRIKDMSDRLISLYAQRQQAKGYSFSEEGEESYKFAEDFSYETTKDQQKAIDETIKDMESPRPMDRLIAGDVGFGKTEVALRAAFKAVLDAKQVAYLVPTTVLARQHYLTFKERFEKYGANVELLSRFVSKAEQAKIIEKISKGLVDVVIGTHRLLSNDITFKDLGLFIIDEEQRFGVEHKERIKEMKVNIDTLTLSATPIPRTLQMAIYGLKDLSMIDTPPLNRYPVQTYVVERQDALIKEAIDRELARGGQVFYLYNKTSDMERIVLKLKNLVPQARVAFAHGKMNKEKMEDVLQDFVDKQYDILVATTIIETGVDIPNTNTLIIHDADKLGLAQLYQIRGRVGRSDKIAYAYMMYEPYKEMNDEAVKRLHVIEDFTDLGSGFKIALRDLSIRGSGDILGHEQSGFIDSVGMDLYMKLLDEVITGKDFKAENTEKLNDFYAPHHIPKNYIDEDAVRIEIHKRIASIHSTDDVDVLKQELNDRFGKVSIDMTVYMYEKLFKKLSAKLGVEKIVKNGLTIKLIMSEEASSNANGERLFYTTSQMPFDISLSYLRSKIEITAKFEKTKEHWTYLMCQFLETYFKNIKI